MLEWQRGRHTHTFSLPTLHSRPKEKERETVWVSVCSNLCSLEQLLSRSSQLQQFPLCTQCIRSSSWNKIHILHFISDLTRSSRREKKAIKHQRILSADYLALCPFLAFSVVLLKRSIIYRYFGEENMMSFDTVLGWVMKEGDMDAPYIIYALCSKLSKYLCLFPIKSIYAHFSQTCFYFTVSKKNVWEFCMIF